MRINGSCTSSRGAAYCIESILPPSFVRHAGSRIMTELEVTQDPLLSLLGAHPNSWMMWPSERLAILGLLEILKPRRSLELGCAQGGLTKWLSEYSEMVVTVDLDAQVYQVTQGLENVRPLCMNTREAFDWIRAQELTFDLTIIDADHSRTGIARDLEQALELSRCIVLHDTYYSPCRVGMLDVLKGRDVYFDLELVPGGLQQDGMWGGLGIVLPGVRGQDKAHAAMRRSTFPALANEWERTKRIKAIQRLPRIVEGKASRVVGRVRSRLAAR